MSHRPSPRSWKHEKSNLIPMEVLLVCLHKYTLSISYTTERTCAYTPSIKPITSSPCRPLTSTCQLCHTKYLRSSTRSHTIPLLTVFPSGYAHALIHLLSNLLFKIFSYISCCRAYLYCLICPFLFVSRKIYYLAINLLYISYPVVSYLCMYDDYRGFIH